MENTTVKYTIVKKRYLADSLSFLGIHYMIFDGENGQKLYSFEDNEKYQYSFKKLMELKKELESM